MPATVTHIGAEGRYPIPATHAHRAHEGAARYTARIYPTRRHRSQPPERGIDIITVTNDGKYIFDWYPMPGVDEWEEWTRH